jgi:release factor glutamine methyltransferase
MTFEVTTATLIPRPETEELVDTITRQWKRVPDATVLDLGTGSGCIAIALARALRFPKVTAIDISAEALNVARKNAAAYRCHIDFRQADMLHLPPESNCMDIIVSNPPYIADSERTSMSANVLDFEPHSALFVPDSDPLLFYTAIARYASTALTQRGALYMEINPLFVGQLRQMLSHYGFADVTILADMQGRQRIAVAHRS